MKLELHGMARSIFNICIQSGIYLEVQWILRTQNQQADYISCLLDTDDWQTTDDLFLSLNARLGPHSVDCFANYYNYKLPKFFSRFWNPNTTGLFNSTSEGRELLGGPACFYRPKGSTLHEVPKGCWYYCCTLLAFSSLLASSYE